MFKFLLAFCVLSFIGCAPQTPGQTLDIPSVQTQIEIPKPEPKLEATEETAPEEPVPEEAAPASNPIKANPADSNQPMIALTFDDGPSTHTRRILDTLTANNSRATFFIPGYMVIKYEDTARAIIEQGSEIGGHSWGHTQYTKYTADELRYDISSTNNDIFNATGFMPTFYRPPYGTTSDMIKSISAEMGMSIINWSIDSEDWKSRDPDKIYDDIMRDVKSGSIILCHDTYSTTADAMERVIPALIEQGYQLVTVSELLGEMEPGKVYRYR